MQVWRLQRPEDIAKSTAAISPQKINFAGVLQQRCWWWMVLAGLSLLLLEMGVLELKGAKQSR